MLALKSAWYLSKEADGEGGRKRKGRLTLPVLFFFPNLVKETDLYLMNEEELCSDF